MPRPKSDLKLISVDLGDADRDLLTRLAATVQPPTRAEAVRQAIRRFARARKIPAPENSEKIPR